MSEFPVGQPTAEGVALTADAPRVQDSLCADCLAHDKSIVSERSESNGRSWKR